MSQSAYVEAISETEASTLSWKFASLRGNIAYATNKTCPLQSCRPNMLSQIPADDAIEADMAQLRALRFEHKTHKSEGMTVHKLNLATTKLRVYSDASFANNKDLSSHKAVVSTLLTARADAICCTGPVKSVAESSIIRSWRTSCSD